ncbi:MAG: tetraacyldisaccharide 4'-kinase [Puniceicoccales bacterium]|jgi:tetraacyldisaccharide 4'-kinase|nr:tetraacyldisaccharide 4'-kinase [Puniceicoccales bacterium]
MLPSVFFRVFRFVKVLGDRLVDLTTDVIYDRAGMTPGVRAYAAFLSALSMLFEAVVRLRVFLYDKRFLRDTPLGCKVVVVGNLTVGGTGKTPVTEKLARVLSERGRKVAIISRGYKSRSPSSASRFVAWVTHQGRPAPRIVSDGKRLLLESAEAGDEPYMLARNLLPLGVTVIVHRDRVEAGAFAISRFACDTILLDDGLQYLPLRGQINLLLVDSTNPFGNRRLLPRGILREPVRNLARGTTIFLTKSNGRPDPDLLGTLHAANPLAEIVECAHVPRSLCTPDGMVTLPLDYLEGRRVMTFSGIATPEKFEDFVRDHGGKILNKRRFRDHHHFTPDEMEDVFDDAVASDAEFVVTTEKDVVRLDADRKWKLPLYYLRLEIDILSGADAFDRTIRRICEGPVADAGLV